MPEETLEACEGFKGAGQKEGLEIWRIEDFEPVLQDKKSYGKFYNQDAYIVLNSKKLKGNNFDYDLHYWMGTKCHKDKQGTVAMRTVELDSLVLGDTAVQHREVQSHESKLFVSYFKQGVQYLEGGTESGFTHVDHDAYIKRLFQIKGKHDIRIEQVECNCGSLNKGDTFVLDDGKHIYVWVGPQSEKKEQLGGVEFARRLRDEEKGGSAHIHIVEEDWETNEQFFDALGSQGTIRASDPRSDDDIVRRLDQETLLYQVAENTSGNGGKWADITEIGEKPLTQSMLKSEHCYALDSGHSGLYLWTGKKCTNEFKKKVWSAANEFLEKRGYPDWVTITRVTDGGETSLFKQYFESWETPGQVTAGKKQDLNNSNIAESDYSGADGIDIEALHKKPDKIEDWMPDDGSAEKLVYRVEDSELVDVDPRAYGAFFGGDSYVIKYTYTQNNKPSHIIYFWQGVRSKTDDKGAAAAFAVQMDRECDGEAVQVRVVEGKEPKHFMKMFGGKLLVFKYGRQRAFNNAKDYEGFDARSAHMFQIRGTLPEETRAIQVDARTSSLDSNDVFIVDYQKKVFVWVGKNSGKQEQEMAKMMVERVNPDKRTPILVKEGEEDNPFWDALGGQEEYYTGPEKTREGQRAQPRLFQCSQASGRFTVEEIVAFTQQDLIDTDVMMLDTYDEIFVWVGKNASDWEKQEAMKTSHKYLECEPTGRNKDNTLIICVNQGFEPLQFTNCFHPWDKELWNQGKTFSEIMSEVGKENAGIALLEDEADKYKDTYTLEELQAKDPPPGVDVTKKEMYLSDGDFFSVFGMTKEEYMKIPQWKRTNMRKEQNLF